MYTGGRESDGWALFESSILSFGAHLGWSQELGLQLAAVRSCSAGVSDSSLVFVTGENQAVSKSRKHCFCLFDDEVKCSHPRCPSL